MNKNPKKPSLLTAIRWFLYLPTAFLASLIAGFLGNTIMSVAGGDIWYVWMVSGAASAAAFCSTAFYVAPYVNAFTKWSTVVILALIGVLSAAGSLIGGEQKASSFAGIAMVVFAVWAAKEPISKLANTPSKRKPTSDTQKPTSTPQSLVSQAPRPVSEPQSSVRRAQPKPSSDQTPPSLPKTSRRPYIKCSTDELERIASSNWNNIDVLRGLSHELSFRSRKKSKDLEERISERLAAFECDSFSWPTTSIANGSQNLSGQAFKHDEGLLRHYGYKVGINGLSQKERIKILNLIFVQSYLPLEDRAYVSEWGEPQTPERLKKLADSIAAFTRNAKRRNNPNFEQAIRDWETDLAYLKRNYYDNRSSFRWPQT